jgi:two-component system NtrC family sensor kinase
MKRTDASTRGLGITGRTTLLAWLVAVVTLLLFVVALLPGQKQTFLDALRSKAYGVSLSLREVAAGAVVNEDYSAVVDYCTEMLRGDPAIDAIVIARNDGFSIVHDRNGWQTQNLGERWRPKVRRAAGEIDDSPLFKRRLYVYSQPFDYSGIEWGWVHVGLSLEGYDAALRRLYRQTALVAVACVVFSLIVSGLYARRLVRPILMLQAVVRRVAGGDLAARAQVLRNDELGSLSGSVNAMTGALQRRDRILDSVRYSAQEFLVAADWRKVLPEVLARIGAAAGASRAYLFENQPGGGGLVLGHQTFEWTEHGVTPQIQNPHTQGIDYRAAGYGRWCDRLEAGDMIAELVADMPASERAGLEPQGIRSLIVIPVRVDDRWWGFLGLDECGYDRVWNDAERASLRAVGDMLGATVARQRAQEDLVEAKRTLEERVEQRTSQLRDQVVATEKALADLAQAQNRLMTLSREAGMAEVATGVLHNVGNVLNSVNVSTNLLRERLDRARVGSLQRTVELLRRNEAGLGEYLRHDPQGRQVLGFLEQLAQHLGSENAAIRAEIESVCRHVDHIKEIVAMQQNYAKPGGLIESVPPAELFEDALRIKEDSCRRHGIAIVREFAPLPPVAVEKHRVLQILVNLLANAVTAVKAADAPERKIFVRLLLAPEGRVRFVVHDTGVGIPAENLTRIFSHGFTTRRDGHGFGLHSGAIAAKSLGGSLAVASEGAGRGATFTLEIPLQPLARLS